MKYITTVLLLLGAVTSAAALPAPVPAPCSKTSKSSAFARAISAPGPVVNYFAIVSSKGAAPLGKRTVPQLDSVNLHALDSSAPIPEHRGVPGFSVHAAPSSSSPSSDEDASLIRPATPETPKFGDQIDMNYYYHQLIEQLPFY
ncbi:hypothetical protein B0H12DRAFT_1137862 [Mycena haematopus]|nr:hypothetical protein B0H12DRAFT_1137862 [Mycena haematopus]